MAKGNLSFSIALNFLTENFKKGTNSVKNGIRAMQMQFITFAAALGASGIGLSNLVSKMIEVARATGRVTTALKNVSGSTAAYANNLRFVNDLAKKYGLEVNTMIGNFAKFTASASQANMAITDQRKIFESVSRAVTAFGLSADDTNGVFRALSQMMSKSKISSEELRGEMGERLPVAMQAMAKAAGVTMEGLEDLMKQGKLMSSDVLPKFADALNEMVTDVDTDNIETSINRLKKIFGDIVISTGIQDGYKSLIDNITRLVKSGADNIYRVIYSLIALLTGQIFGKFFKWMAVELAKAQRAAMIAASKSAKAAGVAFDQVAWKASSAAATLKMVFTRAIATIRTAFMTMLPTAIFTGIALLIGNFIAARKEAEKVKGIFSDYKRDSAVIGRPEESDRLQRLYSIANDINNSLGVRKSALSEINTLLGTSYSIDNKSLKIQGDLNEKVAERVKMLKDAASIEFYQNRKLEAETEAKTILAKYGDVDTFRNAARSGNLKDRNDAERYNQNIKIYFDADKQLQILEKSMLSAQKSGLNPAQTNAGGEKQTPLQKAEEQYTEALKELANQYANNAITEKERNKQLDKINKDAFMTLSSLLTPDQAANNKLFQQAKSGINNSVTSDVESEYWDELQKLANQHAANVITEAEYNKAKLELTQKTIKTIAAIDKIGEEGEAFAVTLAEFSNDLSGKVFDLSQIKKETSRDTTFDYKKDNVDILSEELQSSKDFADKLKEAIQNGAKGLDDELDKALSNTKTLSDALKVAQVKKDVQDLSKELNRGLYSGVKDIANSSDRLVSSFQAMKDVFSDEDASAWERIMAVWSTMINTLDAFMSIVDTIDAIREVTERLAKAKQVEAAIDTQTTSQKVANAATGIAADTAEAAASVATSTTEVAGNTAVAASSAGASAAKLPFPMNLIAIGAAIAGVLALFSAIPKFANGGIVSGGSKTGDLNLARINDGEMILNGTQQYNLFRQLNNPSAGKGSAVVVAGELKVKGKDLVAVIDNYKKKQNRI